VQGLLYPALHVPANGGVLVTLFVVPTTDRDILVACFSPARGRDRAVVAACPRVIDSIALLRGFAYPLEPRPPYWQFLHDTLGRVLNLTNIWLGRYAAARDASGQAAAASQIAGAYATASRAFTAISRNNLSPEALGIHWAIRDDLKAASKAYAALAAALRAGSLSAWRTVYSQVLGAAEHLGAELDQLRKVGFVMG
jgi:hypothetical protein